MGCFSLLSVKIPSDIKKIGKSILPFPFFFDINLSSIQIPHIIGSFKNHVVFGNKYLCSIEIPEGVSFINYSNFSFNNFNYFTIPNTIKIITNYAFCHYKNLTKISIPNSVKKIANYAFSGCSSLKNIEIPFGVKKIAKYAFSGCSSLTNIIIPSSVKIIGDYAFMDCISLPKSFSIPDTVEKVGRDLFLDKQSQYIGYNFYDHY